MADYIKREDVVKQIENAQIISDGENCGYCCDDISISSIPAADVVEVIRCRDCKHCSFLLGKSPLCLGGAAWIPIKENDYCAWGERRTENG